MNMTIFTGTDEACIAIGGTCQNFVSHQCNTGGRKYYERLCRGRSIKCCAKKTSKQYICKISNQLSDSVNLMSMNVY